MASAKLPPRQKMINMMYLVLTAMLAMNISKEVLDQFVLLDADLGRSELAHQVRTSSEYSVFEASAANVPAKFKLPLERAHRAGAAAVSLVAYTEEMKVLAIAAFESRRHLRRGPHATVFQSERNAQIVGGVWSSRCKGRVHARRHPE